MKRKIEKFRAYARRTTLALSIGLVLSACGPSLHSQIAVPRLIPAGAPEANDPSRGAYVFVDQFIDTRGSRALVVVDGRDVLPETEPSDEVVGGIKRALEKKGYTFSDTAAVILAGELRRWSAEVTKGFSSEVQSKAQIYVEVLDPANKRVYSGVYEGFSAQESPALDEDDIREALRTSMTEAISQVVGDTQLMGLLASY